MFLALLAGIVAVAAGLRHTVAQPGHALGTAQALYLGGGVALFLVSDQIGREPTMSRADPEPAPQRSRASCAAAITAGWCVSPR